MKTALALLAVALAGCAATTASAFQAPFTPPPLKRQNAMRMSYHEPDDIDDLDDLDARLSPSLATLLRLASTIAMGGAYFASPVMVAPTPAEAAATATMATTTLTAADRSVLEATCLGFGCGSFNGVDFAGAPKPENGEPSIDMQAFLKAVDEKRVEKVELLDGGNRAYATIRAASASTEGGESGGGAAASERLRIGEGFPIDNPKAWSSPLFVVRILKDRGIPYTLGFDFSGVATQTTGPPRL